MPIVTQTEVAKARVRPLKRVPDLGQVQPWGQVIYSDTVTVDATGGVDTAKFQLRCILPENFMWALQRLNLVMAGGANGFSYCNVQGTYSPDPDTDLENQVPVIWPLSTQDMVVGGASSSYLRFFHLSGSSGDNLATYAGGPIDQPDLFLPGGSSFYFEAANIVNDQGPWSLYYTLIFNGWTVDDYLSAGAHMPAYVSR